MHSYMPPDYYWEWTRKELQMLSERHTVLKLKPVGVFEPGDFAYVDGSLHDVFVGFLIRKGYRLTSSEDVETTKKGRYCVVLERLSLDRYVVCFCSTYGGSRHFNDINNPVARYFGIPLNENAKGPISPLRTFPRWKSDYGAFIFAIPVMVQGLQTSNILGTRLRLGFNGIQRLERFIKERSQSFDQYAGELRAGHLAAHLSRRNTKFVSPIPLEETVKYPVAKFHPMTRKFLKPLLWLPSYHEYNHNVVWLLKRIQEGSFMQSKYLNRLPFKLPYLKELPKPFFPTRLRISPQTIRRLLRRHS